MPDRSLIAFCDGADTLFGSWAYPARPRADTPLVVLLTGDGPNGSEGQTWSQFTSLLLAKGIATFLFDFKGLGHSPGTYEDLTLSLGCSNFDAAMRFIRERGEHDKSRIGLIGSSYGGNIALLKGSEYPEVRAIGLKSPSSFLPEGYQLQYGADVMAEWGRTGFSSEVGLKYSAVLDALFHNTYAAASRIGASVRIVQGTADSAVPIRHSRDLVRVMPNASIFELDGADHWYAEGDEWDRMAEDLVSFMVAELQP
jgi:pimeloyl-ACP methyl ester carboxylesterase